mmetsp:Transcript_95534/g.308361  ORF Transcript_95534/g.308361 Transcript_95534/m.308361 type:complete len:209 (-) Transcript_95534:615-1241(-)
MPSLLRCAASGEELQAQDRSESFRPMALFGTSPPRAASFVKGAWYSGGGINGQAMASSWKSGAASMTRSCPGPKTASFSSSNALNTMPVEHSFCEWFPSLSSARSRQCVKVPAARASSRAWPALRQPVMATASRPCHFSRAMSVMVPQQLQSMRSRMRAVFGKASATALLKSLSVRISWPPLPDRMKASSRPPRSETPSCEPWPLPAK